MSDQPEFEELEQIPWAALAVKAGNPWGRLASIAAGAVVIVVLGLLVSRWLMAGDQATVITMPPAALSSPVAAAPSSGPAAPGPIAEPAATTSTMPVAAVYSEADLMAVPVEAESRLAVMRAELFVQDFFTVDGDEEAAGHLADLVGEWTIPHHDPVGYSYVEWVRAFGVTSPNPGRYAVDVAYRTLVSAGESEFGRSEVRAVSVTVDVDVDGTTRLVDLPVPAQVPPVAAMPRPVGAVATAPDEVVAAARDQSFVTGGDVTVLEARRDSDGWRVVVGIQDGSGNQWPLVVQIASG